ncbi:MAG: sigma-54-dependent Fis family transcriptional regulator, partial [Spongiibacter sp.]|nr:sigma-54-dependent Fis family transcriptional regulator [Spongiibacter sp.]
LVDISQIRGRRTEPRPRYPQQQIPERKESRPRTRNADPAEDLSLEDYFQRFVLEHQDSMSETELAQKLGVSRKCLWERRQRLGIPRKKSARSGSN